MLVNSVVVLVNGVGVLVNSVESTISISIDTRTQRQTLQTPTQHSLCLHARSMYMFFKVRAVCNDSVGM